VATKQKQKIDLDSVEEITFPVLVKIPTANGTALEITFTFAHYTREQLAEMGNARIAEARARYQQALDKKAEADSVSADEPADTKALPPAPDLVQQVRDDLANDVAAVLEIARGWDVEGFEFNEANLTKLFNKYQPAPAAISEAYREAMAKGRLGN
jgi:hypothetical protein